MNQLGDAFEAAGYTPEDVTKLKQFGKLGEIKDVIYGRANIVPVKPESVLEFQKNVKVSIPSGDFIARDLFKVDTSKKAEVKIGWLGDDFKEWFGGRTEKSEGCESKLLIHVLRKSSKDEPILSELGGEGKAETSLSEIWALLVRQGRGEKGTLITNGYANIFYVHDTDGVLLAVRILWHDGYWNVYAYSVADANEWFAGDQVFSRNS